MIDHPAVLLNFLEKIEMYGWALVGVIPGRHPDGCVNLGSAFTYTVGLTALATPNGRGHPELAIFGQGNETSANILNLVCERIRDGLVVRPGELIHGPNPGDYPLTATTSRTSSPPRPSTARPGRRGCCSSSGRIRSGASRGRPATPWPTTSSRCSGRRRAIARAASKGSGV